MVLCIIYSYFYHHHLFIVYCFFLLFIIIIIFLSIYGYINVLVVRKKQVNKSKQNKQTLSDNSPLTEMQIINMDNDANTKNCL